MNPFILTPPINTNMLNYGYNTPFGFSSTNTLIGSNGQTVTVNNNDYNTVPGMQLANTFF